MELIKINPAGTRMEVRAGITQLCDLMAESPNRLSLDAFPVRHTFAPGCYAREMTLPEDTYIIGKIHRHAHLNVLSVGRVQVLTESGPQEYIAPCSFVSEVGTQRVVRVLENTVWTTIHITNETDLDKLERELIMEDHSELELEHKEV